MSWWQVCDLSAIQEHLFHQDVQALFIKAKRSVPDKHAPKGEKG